MKLNSLKDAYEECYRDEMSHRSMKNGSKFKITQVTDYKVVLDPVNGFHLKMTKLYDPTGAKLRRSDASWWFRKIDQNGLLEMNEANRVPCIDLGQDNFSIGTGIGGPNETANFYSSVFINCILFCFCVSNIFQG